MEGVNSGEVGGVHSTGHIGVPGGIYSNAVTPIGAATANVGRIDQDGVDDKRLGLVVARNVEPYAVIGDYKFCILNNKWGIGRLNVRVAGLINMGLMKAHLAGRQPNHQVPISIHADFRVSILDFQTDGLRIGLGGNYKVVFELPLVTVIDEINPGIDAFVFHLCIGRHVRPPLHRVHTDEVVRLARQFVDPLDLYRSIRAHQSHTQDLGSLGLAARGFGPRFARRRVVV